MKIKTVASLCAGIALVASIVAVSSWLELQKQREVNAAWRERQIEAPRPASLPAAPPPVTTVVAATPLDTPISRTESSTPSTAAAARKQKLLDDMLANPASILERLKERLKDQNARKSLLARRISSMEESHPDLAQELGLSKDEAERLFALLADDSLARMDERSLGTPEVDESEALRTSQEVDRQQEESMRALLGDKYAQWQAYLPTRPARADVAALRTHLAGTGMPLTAEQYKAFTTAAVAAHLRQAPEDKGMPQNPLDNPGPTAQREEVLLKRREDNDRRILEAAAPYVDATQLEAIRRKLELQTSAFRMAWGGEAGK